MTFLCGMATGFYSFFIARMGVGVGEAALSPPAHSILSDYFDKEKLPTVMAIFTLGIPVGVGVSYSLGGWVYGLVAEQGGLVLPLLGAVKPWQATFMIVGAPGLIVAALIYKIVEPPRTGVVLTENVRETVTILQTLQYIWLHKRVYVAVFLAISALSIIGYSFMMWFVAHASRVYGIAEHEIGKSFGFMYMVFGIIGTVFGAWLSGILSKRGHVDAGLKVMLVVAILWLVPSVAVNYMPSLKMAYILAAPCIFCLNAYFGVSIAALQLVTPNQMRAQVSSLLLFSTNVFGLLIGPILVGTLSSDVFSGDQSLGNALAVVAAVFCPLSIGLVVSSFGAYRKLLSQI